MLTLTTEELLLELEEFNVVLQAPSHPFYEPKGGWKASVSPTYGYNPDRVPKVKENKYEKGVGSTPLAALLNLKENIDHANTYND
jgi:hypothetical protein